MPIYLFKMWRRFSTIEDGLFSTLMEIDGTGMFVQYNNRSDVKPETIRRHLYGKFDQAAWVHAPDPYSLKEYFRWSYEGARVGKRNPAEWIREDHPILEVPDCGSLHPGMDSFGREEVRCEKTEYPCILNELHWEAEDDYCPVKQISEIFYKANNTGKGSRYDIALAPLGIGRYGLKEEIIDGLKFIRQIKEPKLLPLFDGVFSTE